MLVNFDCGLEVRSIYLKVLILKLKQDSIEGKLLHPFKKFLSNGKQCVVLNGIESM